MELNTCDDLDKIKIQLMDAVSNICCNNLNFTSDLQIEGLIGVTIDQKRIFLVNLQSQFLPIKKPEIILSESEVEANGDQNDTVTAITCSTSPSRKNKRKARPVKTEQVNHLIESFEESKKSRLSSSDDPNLATTSSFIDDEPHTLTSDPVYGEAAIPVSHLNPEPALNNVFNNISQKILSSYEETVETTETVKPVKKTKKNSLSEVLPRIKHPVASKPQSLYTNKPTPTNQRLKRRKPRGMYTTYTKETREELGRYAMMNGVAETVRHYKEKFGCRIGESTVRSMRKFYVNCLSHTSDNESACRKGRTSCLQELEPKVRQYVKDLLKTQPDLSSQVVIAAAKMILGQHGKKDLLKENGGNLDLTKAWADSFLSSVRSPPVEGIHDVD